MNHLPRKLSMNEYLKSTTVSSITIQCIWYVYYYAVSLKALHLYFFLAIRVIYHEFGRWVYLIHKQTPV